MPQVASHSFAPAVEPGLESIVCFDGLSIARSSQERMSYLRIDPGAPSALREAVAHCARVRERVGGFAGLVVFRSDSQPDQYTIHTQLCGHVGQIVERGWDLSRRLDVFVRVARAVQGLHEVDEYVGVLSPQHVLLNAGASPHVLGPGILVPGTEAYQAPESLEGVRWDVRSDVFCLGALLHFLLTGQPLQRRGCQDEPARLGSVMPLGLRRIVRRACAPDPNLRYDSVYALLSDISRHADAERVGLSHEADEVFDAEQSGARALGGLRLDVAEDEPVAAE